MTRPRIHIAPFAGEGIAAVVERAGGEVVSDAGAADAVVWTDPRDPQGLKELLAASPARWVQLPFAGVESFFEAGAITPGRTWTCTKGVYGRATAEHALALILACTRRLHHHARASSWGYRGGFGAPERRLADLCVLIVGTGGIGSALAAMLEPLGPRVVAVNRSGDPAPWAAATHPVSRLDGVLGEADVVVLALALTPESKGLIGAPELAAMRPGSWLVNVARGALVDSDALLEALRSGHLAGAALDVTDPEPLPDGHPLWAEPGCLVTPHVANTWDMARPELEGLIERNVARFAAGEALEGLVDVAAGY